MDFSDELTALSKQFVDRIKNISTEEATKTALVMPFLRCLGYDVFNPMEVVPEFTADIGQKKGERVDYAIYKDGVAAMLIECKPVGAELNVGHATQLQRYFQALPEMKFGVLTNGTQYMFFSDLDRENLMDSKPFLEVDVLHLNDQVVAELKKFSKTHFDRDTIYGAADVLLRTRELRKYVSEQLANPDDEFVKFFAAKVHGGRVTQNVLSRMAPIVKAAFQQLIEGQINATLERAMSFQSAPAVDKAAPQQPPVDQMAATDGVPDAGPAVVTTDEEIEGFHFVKAALAKSVDLTRVAMRDCQSYCGVLLDDNNRKPICRMYFNSSKRKQLGIFRPPVDGGEKTEERSEIVATSDILGHGEALAAIVQWYDQQGEQSGKRPGSGEPA